MRFLSQRAQSYLFMLLNTVLWSLPFLVVKPALSITTPYRFLLYRYLIAIVCSIPFLVYYFYLKKTRLKLKDVVAITLIELVGSVAALAFLYTGLKYVGAIETGFLSASSPLFIALGGVWFLKEREEKHELIGLIFAFLGTFLLIFNPALSFGQAVAQISITGSLLVLVHNMLNMIYFPMMKKHYQHLPKFLATSLSYYVAGLGFLVLSWWESGLGTALFPLILSELRVPSVQLASGYMAVFGSIIGFTAYVKGQDGIEASEAAKFSYLQPLIYIPLGILWLHETVSVIQLAALGLILAGVYLSSARSNRPSPKRARSGSASSAKK
jgi:drug/metabolite transporter (DMT)-like permease